MIERPAYHCHYKGAGAWSCQDPKHWNPAADWGPAELRSAFSHWYYCPVYGCTYISTTDRTDFEQYWLIQSLLTGQLNPYLYGV